MGDMMQKILALTAIAKWATQKEQAKISGMEQLRIHMPDEEGASPDRPNIELPIPRCRCKGLYIMLRLTSDGPVRQQQLKWMDELSKEGYYCALCTGVDRAMEVILTYCQGTAGER